MFCRKKIILAGLAYCRDAVFDFGALCSKPTGRISANFTQSVGLGYGLSGDDLFFGQYIYQFLRSAHFKIAFQHSID